MYVVTKTHNFDPETEAFVFDREKEAIEYLQHIWEEYYNEEIANGSALVESECYHEDDYAKIEWVDGCQTWFHMIETTAPRVIHQ